VLFSTPFFQVQTHSQGRICVRGCLGCSPGRGPVTTVNRRPIRLRSHPDARRVASAPSSSRRHYASLHLRPPVRHCLSRSRLACPEANAPPRRRGRSLLASFAEPSCVRRPETGAGEQTCRGGRGRRIAGSKHRAPRARGRYAPLRQGRIFEEVKTATAETPTTCGVPLASSHAPGGQSTAAVSWALPPVLLRLTAVTPRDRSRRAAEQGRGRTADRRIKAPSTSCSWALRTTAPGADLRRGEDRSPEFL
jgi:hypothetical protein